MLTPEQINLYIAGHPEWQRKLLVRMRQLIHAVNEDVEETWRGQCPHFNIADMPVVGISATKTAVCATFPKGAHFKSARLPYESCQEEKPGRCIKLREGESLNEAAFSSLVNKAMAWALNAANAEGDGGHHHAAHAELENVLRKDPSAWANWGAFSPAHRREYKEWVADGKKEETRKRRIAQALEMIRDGVTKEESEHRVKGA